MKLLAKLRQGVVEIATVHERCYVHPAILERVYFLWAFRNFHRLSALVLSRRHRQILERLSQIARTPVDKRIDADLVIGRAEFATLPARGRSTHDGVPSTSSASARFLTFPSAVNESLQSIKRMAKTFGTRPIGLPRGKARYALIPAYASVVVICFVLAPHLRTDQARFPVHAVKGNPSAQIASAAVVLLNQNAVPKLNQRALPASLRFSTRLDSAVTTRDMGSETSLNTSQEGTRLAARATRSDVLRPSESTRLRVFLAPRSVVYPVLPNSGNVGGVNQTIVARAVVNTAGIVDDVQVPGQNPSLAAAVKKAVKQWQYRPYVLNGQAIEVETVMMFTVLGQDAISVRFLPPGESVASP